MSWGWSEILQTCLTLLQAASERLILNPENSDGCGVGDGTPCILYFQELEKECYSAWWLGDWRPSPSLWQLMICLIVAEHLHFISIWLQSVLCALPLSGHGWTFAAVVWQILLYITSAAVASVIKDYRADRFRMAKTEKCVLLLELH